MKKVFLLAMLATGSIAIHSCNTSSANSPKESVVKETAPPASVGNTWEYSTDEDKMGEGSKNASLIANDFLNFEFPYNSKENRATLVIRQRAKDGTSIMLMVDKGQFSGDYDNPTVRIKFDDEKPKSYSYGTTSDGSSDVIFIHGEKSLVEKIKNSKKVVIEAEFYSHGNEQMIFNTAGLKI